MSDEEIIKWVHSRIGSVPDEECLERHKIYMDYRAEGQSVEVSLQYAGLL